VELSLRILAKYIDLKHVLPYYTIAAKQEQLESAKRKLKFAEETARKAQRDLVDLGPGVPYGRGGSSPLARND